MKRLNWRPDLPDSRDYKYTQHLAVAEKAALPKSVDLRPYCPPVVDQGDIGSCTGNSIAGMMGFMELRAMRYKVAAPEVFDAAKFSPFSRLFIYYNERVIEGDPTQDGGAEIRDGIKSIASTGVCSETTWTYSDAHALKKPTAASYTEAKNHVVKTYYRIENLTDMKTCLAAGYPFVFGFTVYDNFMSDEMASTGMLSMPGENDSVQGGHAVMCVGYDDKTQMVLVRNSWGTDWGIKGYFWMPYQYITDPNLADDAWTIRK